MTDIAKAGWLMRQSTILKRWKKEWFALTIDGYLRYFETPDKLIGLDTINLPNDALRIRVRSDVRTEAPTGYSQDFLIQIENRKKDDWIICAENVDEMLAWQMALEQARVMHTQNPQQPYQQIPPYLREVLAH